MAQLAMLLPASESYGDKTSSGWHVRKATREDNQALAVLLGAAFEDGTWTAGRVERELTGAGDVLAVMVIEDEGRIIATASARHWKERFPDAGYVHWVAVDPEMRGRRLGRAVVEAVIDFLEGRELAEVVLETDDVRLPAISTYLGMGFVPVYLDSDHCERWSRVFSNLHAAKASQGGVR
ncbi:GNAT family N-acetyltransferase [Sinomonas terrae]|uniref:GNAT family N-acetyltransferase n=1 Tax=Sinomonas terrae TaxID=2908838 RepID=A0ABS9U756_9MICC|nr:GNAT family N-acetyltransferase [Sinomonas terrae]MCH6472543.1 GNAT family N-acetyltransferase [Sinomonas terrae]